MSPDDRIIESTIKASEHVQEWGLIYKGNGFCHGIGGNAIALISSYTFIHLYLSRYSSSDVDDDCNNNNFSNVDNREAIAGSVEINSLLDQLQSVHNENLLRGIQFLRFLCTTSGQNAIRFPDEPFSLMNGYVSTLYTLKEILFSDTVEDLCANLTFPGWHFHF